MNKKNRWWLVWWAYLVELLAASMLLVAVIVWFGADTISGVIDAAGARFASHFAAVMFAASLGMTWTFYAKSDTEFADWLYQKKAFRVYARAFMTSVGIYAALVVALVLALSTSLLWIDLVAAWLSILGAVNVYTLLINVFDLMLLTAKFHQANKSRNK